MTGDDVKGTAVSRPMCRHCNRVPMARPRGLCWCCFKDVAVRNLYPVDPVFGRRGSGTSGTTGAVPEWPTSAAPGTAEKRAVMANRAARGQTLFHPADAAG